MYDHVMNHGMSNWCKVHHVKRDNLPLVKGCQGHPPCAPKD